jgi:hypothetical protein
MPSTSKAPLGEVRFLPPLYRCREASPRHSQDPCPQCQLIRPPEKTERMKTLTALQQALLSVIREYPQHRLSRDTIWLMEVRCNSAVGRLDLVRLAVAAGQLEQRGLLRYERSPADYSQLDWWVTDEGMTYLD